MSLINSSQQHALAVFVGDVFDHEGGALISSKSNSLDVEYVLGLILLLRLLVLLLGRDSVLSVQILVGMLLAGMLLLPRSMLLLS